MVLYDGEARDIDICWELAPNNSLNEKIEWELCGVIHQTVTQNKIVYWTKIIVCNIVICNVKI